MAKYDIDYACGHGSYTEQLYGKGSDRESRIAWLKANKVCPECYKAKKQAEDAIAPKVASINLVPGSKPVLACEVSGQIEANKAALYALGYRWSNSAAGGMLGYFSMSAPKRILALVAKVESPEVGKEWISARQNELAALGYSLKIGLNDFDFAYLAKLVADRTDADDTKSQARARLAEIEAADPKPAPSALFRRIEKIQAHKSAKWNGKIYGKKGSYNFYVANEKYTATDAEVAEREAINSARAAWTAKYAEEIEAAK